MVIKFRKKLTQRICPGRRRLSQQGPQRTVTISCLPGANHTLTESSCIYKGARGRLTSSRMLTWFSSTFPALTKQAPSQGLLHSFLVMKAQPLCLQGKNLLHRLGTSYLGCHIAHRLASKWCSLMERSHTARWNSY